MLRRPARWDVLSTRRQDNTNGCRGWWTFQDGTAIDWSGNQNNGVFVGSPRAVSGIVGNALSVSNGNYVSLNATAVTNLNNFINGSSGFSVACWIYSTTTQQQYAGIVSFAPAGSSVAGFSCEFGGSGEGATSSLAMGVRNGSNTFAFTPSGTIANNQWYRALFVYDGTQGTAANRVKIYVNGVVVSTTASGTLPTTISIGSSPLFLIGAGVYQASMRYCVGYLEDARLYVRSLSAGEAHTDYNQALAQVGQPEGELPVLYLAAASGFNPAWATQANWLNGAMAGT